MNQAASLAGRLIVLEGPEGAGKSTQAQRLARALTESGHEVVVTREPGGSAAGERIRTVLLDPEARIGALAEFLLYAADRAQHVEERIAPALARGATVVCDRFAASSVAYQGYGRGVDLDLIHRVNDAATHGLPPRLTILLDLPSEAGLRRIAARGVADRLERADIAFHQRVREGFLREAERDGGWLVVNAEQDEAVVAAEILRAATGAAPAGTAP